jgi:hypothetical protein
MLLRWPISTAITSYCNLSVYCPLNPIPIGVAFGNGDGTFQPTVDIQPDPANFIAVGDFNGAGVIDIAVTAGESASAVVGNGDGSFQSPMTYPVGRNQIDGIALAD